VKSTVAFELG